LIAIPAVLHKLKYRVLDERLAVCRLAAEAAIPLWAIEGEFFCVVRTPEEVSLVCTEDRVPPAGDGLRVESGWTALKLEGPFPFAMTGVLASFLNPLAEAGIPIFAISTFDTDYVLVKSEVRERVRAALGAAGHEEIEG
jgi:uncharacterized protein